MQISLVVAVADNWVIGEGNNLPWNGHLIAHRHRMLKLIDKQFVIMGKKTFQSQGVVRPKNTIVVSHSEELGQDIIVVHSIDEAIKYVRKRHLPEVIILGGATIFEQTIERAHKIYLTRVWHKFVESSETVYFPKIKDEQWGGTADPMEYSDLSNSFSYQFSTLERRV